MSDELKDSHVVGCVLSLWGLLVTGPMWLFLLFGILEGLGDAAPQWAWTLYFLYVPSYMVGIIISIIAKNILRD